MTDATASLTKSVFLASGVKVDPKSQALDRLFFRRLLEICRPYWTRKGSWRARLWLGLAIGLSLVETAVGGMMTLLNRDISNALVSKNVADYWTFWLTLSALGLGIFLTSLASSLILGHIEVDWRRWMSAQLIEEYLGARTYYAITVDGGIDNPDQRIQEEVKPVISSMAHLPSRIIDALTNITLQMGILAAIAMPMLLATLAYCVLHAIVTYVTSKPTIRQNWNSTVAEADFRFGLLHVRDHAETIAFYRGENGERRHLLDRLAKAAKAQWIIVRYSNLVSLASKVLSLVWDLLPMLFVAPLYFSGKIEFGSITAATMAAAMINRSTSTFISFIPTLTAAVPHVVRVAEIREKFARLSSLSVAQETGQLQRETSTESIAFEHTTLMTPGGERTLFRNLSFELPKGQALLIAGPTGTGKSSVLRAMAGLWNLGHGTVRTPQEEKTVYLPQRPYMVLGSLRHQLLYPGNAAVAPSDEDMFAALREACLEGLVERYPDLSVEADWGRILSLGEQQRIGFARAFLSGAEFIFLDEATSAVDVKTERRLYTALLSRKITLISVGHRPTLFAYHNHVLELRTDESGELMTIERYLATAPEALAQPILKEQR